MIARAARLESTLAITLAFCSLSSALEGFDIASMGLAAPKLVAELHVSAQHLGLILSAVPLGMLIGALVGGPLADALGRKIALALAVAVIGCFQFATALATGYVALIGVRICCGIGIGAALCNVIALAAEAAGESGSVSNVALAMAGLPAGGIVASTIAIAGGEQGDWRSLFYVGGLAPLLLAVLMAFALPESRAYIEVRLRETASRIPGRRLAMFFGRGRSLTTLCLWISYFATSVVLYVLVNWTSTLMNLKGFSKTEAVAVGLPIGIGGLLAPILVSRIIRERRAGEWLLVCYSGVALGLIGLAEVEHNFAVALVTIAVTSTLVQALSFSLAGLAALHYPTRSRGTGTGVALGAARLGAICGPAAIGFLLGSGLSTNQVLWSLVPVALVAAVTAYIFIATRNTALQPKSPTSP